MVKEKTAAVGVDVIIDFIGGPYWDQNIASMAILGRLVEVGLMGGGQVEVDLRQLMAKRLQVCGTGLRGRSIEEKLAVTALFKRHLQPPPGLREHEAGGGPDFSFGRGFGCSPLHGDQRQFRKDRVDHRLTTSQPRRRAPGWGTGDRVGSS